MVVVVVVAVVVAGRGGCAWFDCFFDSGMYYFIVDDILFYCDVYIILLR